MKTLNIFLLVMCITLITNAQNVGWHLLPFVPKYQLWDIHCVNEDTAVAVGDHGYIIRTTNGGSHWDSIYSTTTYTLYKVTFLNDSVGYICGRNGTVLKTENSGLTWTNIGISTSLNFLSISFLNQDTGWITGGNGEYPYDLYGDKGILMKTFDGGKNWHVDTNYTSIVFSVYFLDNDIGYIALNNGNNCFLCKTKDGGLSYDTIQQDGLTYRYSNVVFLNFQTGYFVKSTNSEGVYKTDDYGITWNKIIETHFPILNILIVDSCNMYYNYWDNRVGFSFGNTLVGINHCSNTIFFDGLNLNFFGFDFINIDYGFCVGKGEIYGNNTNYIYKMGKYDEIVEIEKNDIIQIFPNPVQDVLTVEIRDIDYLFPYRLAVLDVLGKEIKYFNINDSKTTLNISDLSKGFYFLHIQTHQGVSVKRFVKE